MAFFDHERETLDRNGLERLQEERLGRLMAELPRNPFYRAKLEAAAVESRAIRHLDELGALPLTTKAELLDSQSRHPPYGELPTYPLARYRYFHQTSGTSGRPLLWLDTEDDWSTWLRCWGQVYGGAGVDADDVVFCAFSFGPFIAHWSALAGARSIGALGLPGSGMSSLQRLETMLERRATVLVSTPTYALHLAEVAREHGIDLAASPVKVTIHAGEPGASVPNVKRQLEAAWGARAFDHAGATEVGAWGFDCQADDGAIHLNELEFIFEVLDAEGEAVADGGRGELVITTLGRLGMPVVRYRTGDIVVRTAEPCACGRHLARIEGGVLGRADDMLTVRGVNLYPSAVDDLIRGIPEIVEYQAQVRREGELDEVRIRIECDPEAERPFDEVERALQAAFRSRLGIRVGIAQAEPGSLPRFELKAQRFQRLGPGPGA